MYVLYNIILLCDIVKGIIRDTHYRKSQKSISHVANDVPVKSIVLLLELIQPAVLPRLTPGAKVRYKGSGEVVICCFTTVMPSISVFR